MRLTLKYAEKTKAGGWQYRRRVPKAVSSIITKREFKQKLGETQNDAQVAWAKYHAQVEREIAAANRRISEGESVQSGAATDRETYTEAQRRVHDLVAHGASDRERELMADSFASSYPLDPEHDTPIGATKVDEYTINLLRLGPKQYPAPEPTLSDATAFYLKERPSDESPEVRQRFEGTVSRIVLMVRKALGRDPALTSLTREDARQVRDYMLDRVKSTGERISPASVARDMNGLKALINFAAVEMPLPATFQNPFNKLNLGQVRGRASDGEKRDPLPPKVLAEVRKRIVHHARADLALIWRILEGTGCRLAEVSGLRVEDVDVAGELPNLRVTWHESRRIKTNASRRYVPLVADALEAVKEALALPGQGNLLFPAYGSPRGADAASAALMKHLRAVTSDPKHVVHSLRHNMKDRLMLAEVASLDQNLILGHALGGVGDRVYGGDAAKLRVTTRAMQKALALP